MAAAVLSGNRNFEGRINPLVRANYLASPPLVVAYAIAGTRRHRPHHEPLGHDDDGEPVYLKDIWPTPKEIQRPSNAVINPGDVQKAIRRGFRRRRAAGEICRSEGDLFEWDRAPPTSKSRRSLPNASRARARSRTSRGARVLAMLGDSVTTDHISPAGAIAKDSPAGRYLDEKGVEPVDFNTYGARRGNHEVMMRGTFANIRLKNEMVPGTEGGWTTHYPWLASRLSIYDAAMRYKAEGTPLVIIAGKEYGTGSSRDWAAKGTLPARGQGGHHRELRAHPPQQSDRDGRAPLAVQAWRKPQHDGLDGTETIDITGIADLEPGQEVTVSARKDDGSVTDVSGHRSASTALSKSTTTRTAASSRPCSGGSLPPPASPSGRKQQTARRHVRVDLSEPAPGPTARGALLSVTRPLGAGQGGLGRSSS